MVQRLKYYYYYYHHDITTDTERIHQNVGVGATKRHRLQQPQGRRTRNQKKKQKHYYF